MNTIAHRIKSPPQNNAHFLCSQPCFAYCSLHGNNYGGNATTEVNFTTSSIFKLQFCYLDDIKIRMIITVITSSTSWNTTSSNLKVDLQLPGNQTRTFLQTSFFFLPGPQPVVPDGHTFHTAFYGWYSTIEDGWRHAELCRRHSPSEWDFFRFSIVGLRSCFVMNLSVVEFDKNSQLF